MTPLQLAAVAAATGIGWGVVMALVAWLRDGSEVVLLQSWILIPAWCFGRAAGDPRMGMLAGLALVGGAVWAYELLPMWGLEAMLAREIPQTHDRAALALALDREDIVLVSTLAIGALVGMGGGLRSRPHAAAAPGEPPRPAFEPPQPPPPPLWARIDPSPSLPLVQPAPVAAPAPAPARESATPWGAAFLVAAAATDLVLDLYGMYSGPQGGLAIAFAVAGGLACVWLGRRYALAMIVAGVVLASAFATVQHAEYGARAPEPPAVVR